MIRFDPKTDCLGQLWNTYSESLKGYYYVIIGPNRAFCGSYFTWPLFFKSGRWIGLAQLVFLILIHWIEIYPADSAIHILNNWGRSGFQFK